jgi:ABC-type transport system involved in multi-copper enzyme maturation permease subunit
MNPNIIHLPLFAITNAWIYPLWRVGFGIGMAIVGLVAISFLFQLFAPRMIAISRATAKEAIAQPLFFIILALGVFLLMLFSILPYNTFGEDLKFYKDCGLRIIMVLSVGFALWTASLSIAEEIDGRTALTVLSKPIGRWQFILGKYFGILWPVMVMFVVLGAVFLSCVSYKVAYDARETAAQDPTAEACLEQMHQITPGLALVFMEAAVLASIAVAISTRLSMLPNLVICGSIYLLGHLVPLLSNSAVGKIPQVGFVASLLSAVLPVLENFDISAVAFLEPNQPTIPLSYLGLSAVYCLLYCGLAMLLALLLFEDRDLA